MKQAIHRITVFLSVFCFLSFINAPSNPTKHQKRNVALEVSSQIASNVDIDKGGGSSTIGTSICKLPQVEVPKAKLEPIFLPSYPGSGTKLQWEIVEALTGLPTTDDAFSNGHHNVVAIKTHYPCMAGRTFPGAEEIPKAILFVRHPMDSLQEYFNIIHSSEQTVPYDMDRLPVAPFKAWKEWRDQAFSRELETWRKHFEYWMDRYDGFSRLVVSYEHFVTEDVGPQLSLQIAEFLSRSEGVNVIAAEDVPCVWKILVDKFLSSRAGDAPGEEGTRVADSEIAAGIHEGDNKGEDSNVDADAVDRRDHHHLRRRRLQMSMSNTQKTPYQIIFDHQKMERQQQQQRQQTQQQQPQTMQPPNADKQQQILDDGHKSLIPPEQHIDFSQMSARPDDEEAEPDDVSDPLSRPYTEYQLREMVNVLATMLEKYGSEMAVSPVLVQYIDEVERRASYSRNKRDLRETQRRERR